MTDTNFAKILYILKTRFNLNDDRADDEVIEEDIRRGVEIQGTNLWVLICAIVIASVGLNVNSTAVIIGAMLISPLMGPIMGVGLGVAIFDFELIKSSSKNLALAALVSLVASTIYFLLSPLSFAQSEILARTTPSIWDVFIAFFGGLAGMIAATRKSKSNVIPGVAIATALMPPLCTAGYGVSSGQWQFFVGAFYLFFINSVFICLGTFTVTKVLRFRKKSFVDKNFEKKVKRYIATTVILTIIPSIYMAYGIVNKAIVENRVRSFVDKEFSDLDVRIIGQKLTKVNNAVVIDLAVVGPAIEADVLKLISNKLKDYGLENAKLQVRNMSGNQTTDLSSIKMGIIEDLYKKNEELIKDKDAKIGLLEKELIKFKELNFPSAEFRDEIKTQYQEIQDLYLASLPVQDEKQIVLAYIKVSKRLSSTSEKKIKEWLKVKTKTEDVKVIFEI